MRRSESTRETGTRLVIARQRDGSRKPLSGHHFFTLLHLRLGVLVARAKLHHLEGRQQRSEDVSRQDARQSIVSQRLCVLAQQKLSRSASVVRLREGEGEQPLAGQRRPSALAFM